MTIAIWDNEARLAAQAAARCYDGLTDESELAFYRTAIKGYIQAISDEPEKHYAFNFLEDAFGSE